MTVELRCVGCGKQPHEIDEYRTWGAMNDMTPAEFVHDQEGTLNHDTGRFWCTKCYIAAGSPKGTAL